MHIKPLMRESKIKAINEHERRCAKSPDLDFAMIGDSIVTNFKEHCMEIWEQHFPKRSMILGISGDQIGHVWYRMLYGGIPKRAKVVVVHVGTNNVQYNTVTEITCAIVSMCDAFIEKYKGTLILSGLLPRLKSKWNKKIQSVNLNLESELCGKCYFVNHSAFTYHKRHFWHDGLHLSADGYEVFAKSIHHFLLKPSHSSVLKCKSTSIHFQYDIEDFPALDNSCDVHTDISEIISACCDAPKPPPSDTNSQVSPKYDKVWSERKKTLKGIVRKRAPRYTILLPPIIWVEEPEYEPWEPIRNNRRRKRAPKTPETSDSECTFQFL